MAIKQLPLFPPPGAKPKTPTALPGSAPAADLPSPAAAAAGMDAPLTARSSLTAAITGFYNHMLQQGLSKYTVQAFGGDLNIFRKHVGSNVPLDDITTQTLQQFLQWLRYDRGVPCKPKSYQRRLTTLKVFFAWLRQANVIAEDPAAPIAHQPVTTPLPEILYPDQVQKLLDAARQLRDAERGDTRPYLLVTLLLATGIKKSEAMAIRLADLDVSMPGAGVLYIRYDDAKKRHKERKLKLPADFAATLSAYRAQYQPHEHLLECTARNLEYVLADLAKLTGLGDTVSFESLRWTCAVQDFQNGMGEDHIRQKLGLSTITWDEAGDKLRRLAGKPL